MARVIEVSLLGPPRVERDGELVGFETRKAVALLALLAVSERARTRDALVDLLWPGNDPAHGRAALRRTLSDLRAAIGTDRVEATQDHVRLATGPDITVDVVRFRDLCAQRRFHDAVESFRGEFLEGLAVRHAPEFEDWVQVESENLRRDLTVALASLTGEREAAGDLPTALSAARRWAAVDPLHEPAHRALIRLYASLGDRVAAIEQYRTCVRTLSRELGVPPLRETTAVYEAVSRGEYAVASAPPASTGGAAPVAAEPQMPPLVGRSEELREARAVYDAVDGGGRVVLVEGEAGIGKTRLADELLSAVRRRGGRVIVGRAYEDEGHLAYAPVAEALRARLHEGREWLDALEPRTRTQVARLLPEVQAGRSAGADSVPPARSGAETLFLAALWDALAAAVGGSRAGALLLDDVHWADEATLGLLAYGVRRLTGRPMLLVLTWRAPHEHPLRRGITAAVRAGGSVLHLGRLGEADVGTLLRAVRPGHEPADAGPLWQQTEGVPLLLVEYLRAAGADPGLPVPTGVREVLSERLGPVGETGRQVLSAAAVVGRAFHLDTVRAVSGRTEEETVTALEEAVRRGLVVEREHDYDFAHHLLRVVAYDETSLARRRLLHARAARLPGVPAATAARHLQGAGREKEAAEAFRAAGEQARTVFAHAEALDHLRSALALGHPEPAALHVTIADVQAVLGDYAGALTSLEEAAATCRPAELATVEQRLGRLQYRRGEYALAQAHLEAALAAGARDDPAKRADLLVDLSLAAEACGDVVRAARLAAEARACADEAGDPSALCKALNRLGMLASGRGDAKTALECLERGRELAERLADPDLVVAVLNNQALAHRVRGDLPDAITRTQEALTLCASTGDRHHEAALENNLADLLHASGRHEEAMAHLKRAVEIFAEVGGEDEPRPGVWRLVRW